MDGQMTIYDYLPDPEEEKPLREPCRRRCDVEWGSLTCFLRRGYVRDKSTGKWARRADGKIMRLNKRDCDWKTSGEIDFSCMTSWKNPANRNGIMLGKCPYEPANDSRPFRKATKKCEECETHIRFYEIAKAHRELEGCTWAEAVNWTTAYLEIESYYLKVPEEEGNTDPEG